MQTYRKSDGEPITTIAQQKASLAVMTRNCKRAKSRLQEMVRAGRNQ